MQKERSKEASRKKTMRTSRTVHQTSKTVKLSQQNPFISLIAFLALHHSKAYQDLSPPQGIKKTGLLGFL